MRSPLGVRVHPDARVAIAAAAAAAYPRETGGILLGWWDDGQVAVRYAAEVSDPDATMNSWCRDELRAQTALDTALAQHQHPWLGYVGDWHSHPAACGASRQDLASIKRASRQYEQPLVLLIHRADNQIETITARRGHRRQITPLTVTAEGPKAP